MLYVSLQLLSLCNIGVAMLMLVAGEVCDYEYCWRCQADYVPIREEGNEHHAPGCKYHSENL